MEQIRSFIAIELPDELRRELGHIQARLKSPEQPSVKWVDAGSIHLTLKFLGSIAADRTNAITGAINEAVRGIAPFSLTARGLGVFPNPRRPQVIWVGVGGEVAKLEQLKQRLEARLIPLGFAAETRPFSAHLTLARLRPQASPAERQGIGRRVTATDFTATNAIEVAAICLMRSQLTPKGAIYHRLSSAVLKK